jgi:hypothetical protein
MTSGDPLAAPRPASICPVADKVTARTGFGYVAVCDLCTDRLGIQAGGIPPERGGKGTWVHASTSEQVCPPRQRRDEPFTAWVARHTSRR